MTRDPSALIDLRRFGDPQALAQGLAQAVAADLRRAVAAKGHASLAVSGGSTPQRFMQALSAQSLDWHRVTVTLVDERWVPEDQARSNAALVRAHLLSGAAVTARFLPLFRDLASPEEALAALEDDLAILPLPLDVVVLGMGGDGHTASFFPGGDNLEAALDPAGSRAVLGMRAEAAGEPRVTLTLPVLLRATTRYLHIEGHDKLAVLERALAPGTDHPLPIARVLRAAPCPVATFWAA